MTDRTINTERSSFVLAVEGAGAFLVVRQALIEVGPSATHTIPPTIPLQIERDLERVRIERVEEDYFVTGGSGLLVNEQPATRHLLRDGDKIALGPRCRLTYHRPHAASTTATLSFTGARLPRTDLRRAILMDREIIISQAPSAHLRLPGLAEPIMLVSRGEQVHVRHCGDEDRHTEAALQMNRTVRVGPLCLTMARV